MAATVNANLWNADFTTFYKGTNEWSYIGLKNSDSSRIELQLHTINTTTFTMDSVNGVFVQYYHGSKLYEPYVGTGSLTISSVKKGMSSGTFDVVVYNAADGDSVKITDGKFDGFPSE